MPGRIRHLADSPLSTMISPSSLTSVLWLARSNRDSAHLPHLLARRNRRDFRIEIELEVVHPAGAAEFIAELLIRDLHPSVEFHIDDRVDARIVGAGAALRSVALCATRWLYGFDDEFRPTRGGLGVEQRAEPKGSPTDTFRRGCPGQSLVEWYQVARRTKLAVRS